MNNNLKALTKMNQKNVCLSHLLNIFANIIDEFNLGIEAKHVDPDQTSPTLFVKDAS